MVDSSEKHEDYDDPDDYDLDDYDLDDYADYDDLDDLVEPEEPEAKRIFRERVARIEERAAREAERVRELAADRKLRKTALQVDTADLPPDERGLINREDITPKIPDAKPVEMSKNALYPATILGAFLLGGVAVVLGRWARFIILGFDPDDIGSDVTLLIDGFMAFLASFVITQMTELRGAEYVAARTNGLFLTLFGMHNFVHWFPAFFSRLFSPEWVEAIIAATQVRTFIFRAVIIPF